MCAFLLFAHYHLNKFVDHRNLKFGTTLKVSFVHSVNHELFNFDQRQMADVDSHDGCQCG